MKSNMRTGNNEILEKINILTKDVILSKTLNNEVNHENIINPKSEIFLKNPLFKEKLYSVFSEIPNKKVMNLKNPITLNPKKNNNTIPKKENNKRNEIYNNEKREILNKKKDEILYLLNPLDAQLNKNRRKRNKNSKIKSNYPFFQNEIKTFPERIRNEINKILFKDGIIKTEKSEERKNKNSLNTNFYSLKSGNNNLSHRRINSSNYRFKNNQNKKKVNSIVESIQKLKLQYEI
jgi:hypothetical protein